MTSPHDKCRQLNLVSKVLLLKDYMYIPVLFVEQVPV